MKTPKCLLALMLALLLGCSMAAAEAPTDVMATVNGTPITRQTYENYLSNLTLYYEYNGYDVTLPENAAFLRYMALNTLVELTLMDQKIVTLGVTLTDAERTAAEAEGRALWVEDVSHSLTYYGVTPTSSEAQRAAAMVKALADMEERGYTEETYVAEAVANALYIKLEAMMVQGASVPEGEVEIRYAQLVEADRQRYAEDAGAYESTLQLNIFAQSTGLTEYYTDVWYVPEGYRTMVHIMLPVDAALLSTWGDLQATWEEQQNLLEEGGTITGEAVSEDEVENARLAALAAAQPTVDEINARLEAGEVFTDLIPLYTADEALNEPGEIALGYPVHMDSIFCPAGYRDAAFTLEQPGDVSEPFLSDGGVYILCYVGDAAGGAVPLTTEVHAKLHERLLAEAQAEQYQLTMASWQAEADIVYSNEALTFMPTR